MNKIFERLYKPLISSIENIIGDHEEAKDMAVEIFKEYRDEIERYEDVEDLTEIRQILLQIARKKSFIFLKRRKIKQQEKAAVIFLQGFPDFEASREEAMIEEEYSQLLKKGPGKLSKNQYKVLEFLLSKVPTTEAANSMNIAPSTFRNTKSAVLKKLKAVLKSGGFIIIVILLVLSIIAQLPVAQFGKIKPSKIFKTTSWKHIK
jgi:DNA-directed RNA polymerase specialized sigma24 family protein